jgi:two-component system sensor histidine kinase KdpD
MRCREMNDARPDPDILLAHVQAEEARARRGRLRIFFGASAGVGKTYAMLEAARGARASGTDIAVGYVEPHGRAETERLLQGLEQIPTLGVSYRGLVRQELDLDAVLRRRPGIVLVDELAHSNLSGGEPPPRHPKRWQDVHELLDAGINVWTTVNVQHLESLNDLVTQLSGVRQLETLPDRVFDDADEVELIDLPPEDLLARLHAGKIYLPDAAAIAADRFFRRSNLLALRELALRRVADRVEATARASQITDRRHHGRLAGERVMVAVGPDDQAEQLVRAGKRMAGALDADWIVVYVETPELLRLSETERNRRVDVLRLAESLGAETVTLDGPTAAAVLLEYAPVRQATRVLVGTPKPRTWRTWRRPSTATYLVKHARGFDVVIIAGTSSVAGDGASAAAGTEVANALPMRWDRYAWALATTLVCTGAALLMYPHFELVNLAMVYLLGGVVAGLRFGRGPSVVAAIANVVAFDFCFVPPRFNLAVSDAQYLVTFAVMLAVALTIATLMASVRQQSRVAGARERRTALLYAMSRELAATRGTSSMALVAVRHVAEVFQCSAVVLLPDETGKLHRPRDVPVEQSFLRADLAVAQWVADHVQRAGLGSDTLPAAPALYLPLGDGPRARGVLAVLPVNPRRVLLPEQRHLLETFAGQIGLALERARLAEDAEASRVAAESESLRNTLLASISHDLRTPLAVIVGAGSTLAEHGAALDEATRVTLARSIESKAREMTALVSNVLDLMRLETGDIRLHRDWQTLDDLVGSALRSLAGRIDRHPVDVRIAPHVPQVYVDASLIVQVISNLLDNAVKYTPPGTAIHIAATTAAATAGEAAAAGPVRIAIEDDGPGLPSGDPERLFAKFQRGDEEGTVTGVGLGLAICRAALRAHGGDISAGAARSGGARFEITLPVGGPEAAEERAP